MSKDKETPPTENAPEKIRTCQSICEKCENYYPRIFSGHVACLLNLENMDFEPKTEGNNLVVTIDADEEKGEEQLTTVPADKCPFYLEQLLEANKRKDKGE